MNPDSKTAIRKMTMSQIREAKSNAERITKIKEFQDEVKQQLHDILTQQDTKELEEMFESIKKMIEKGNGELKRILDESE
jgi:phosphopantothenate synthetase